MATALRKRWTFTPQQRQYHVKQIQGIGLSQAVLCPVTYSLWQRATAVFADVPVTAPVSASSGAPVLGSAANRVRLPDCDR